MFLHIYIYTSPLQVKLRQRQLLELLKMKLWNLLRQIRYKNLWWLTQAISRMTHPAQHPRRDHRCSLCPRTGMSQSSSAWLTFSQWPRQVLLRPRDLILKVNDLKAHNLIAHLILKAENLKDHNLKAHDLIAHLNLKDHDLKAHIKMAPLRRWRLMMSLQWFSELTSGNWSLQGEVEGGEKDVVAAVAVVRLALVKSWWSLALMKLMKEMWKARLQQMQFQLWMGMWGRSLVVDSPRQSQNQRQRQSHPPAGKDLPLQRKRLRSKLQGTMSIRRDFLLNLLICLNCTCHIYIYIYIHLIYIYARHHYTYIGIFWIKFTYHMHQLF